MFLGGVYNGNIDQKIGKLSKLCKLKVLKYAVVTEVSVQYYCRCANTFERLFSRYSIDIYLFKINNGGTRILMERILLTEAPACANPLINILHFLVSTFPKLVTNN